MAEDVEDDPPSSGLLHKESVGDFIFSHLFKSYSIDNRSTGVAFSVLCVYSADSAKLKIVVCSRLETTFEPRANLIELNCFLRENAPN